MLYSFLVCLFLVVTDTAFISSSTMYSSKPSTTYTYSSKSTNNQYSPYPQPYKPAAGMPTPFYPADNQQPISNPTISNYFPSPPLQIQT